MSSKALYRPPPRMRFSDEGVNHLLDTLRPLVCPYPVELLLTREDLEEVTASRSSANGVAEEDKDRGR